MRPAAGVICQHADLQMIAPIVSVPHCIQADGLNAGRRQAGRSVTFACDVDLGDLAFPGLLFFLSCVMRIIRA